MESGDHGVWNYSGLREGGVTAIPLSLGSLLVENKRSRWVDPVDLRLIENLRLAKDMAADNFSG